MGYYADLIKQKQEKRNSRYSYKLIDKGYYGVRKEEEYHKWVVQTWYGTKLVDEQEVTGPKSKAEAQGQKNVSAFERRYPENSKEEKDNDSEGRLMEIAEKVLREYPESTKSYAKFEDRFLTKAGWGYNPSKVKTIKEIWERVANSKEEKDNVIVGKTKMSDAEFRKTMAHLVELKKDPSKKKEYEEEIKKFRDLMSVNEKEEKDNASEEYIRKMYAEIQELKRKGVKDIDKYYAAINQYKEAEEQMKRYKETGKSYYKTAADNLKREADQWMREIKASMHNEKEEGYYAKLAEEKKAKRNALEPVQRAEQLAREGKQYKDIVETIKKEYNLPTDKATRAADQGKRNYELNPINGEHKKPAKI